MNANYNEVPGILAGPAKNANAVRVVHHGAVSVRGTALCMRLTDGRHLRITLGDAADMQRLADELTRAAKDRALTEITMAAAGDDEFLGGRVYGVENETGDV